LRKFKASIVSGLLIVLIIVGCPVWADDNDDEFQRVKIADPFINLHTGPGSAYPIFHVIDRGSQVVIIRRQTDWFEIKAENGKTGWASRADMQMTLLPDGELLNITDAGQEDFQKRDWSFGVTGGEFENAAIVSVFSGYSFTENLAVELNFSHSPGSISSSTLLKLDLLMQPFPEWTVSPFFSLGVGNIKVRPSATLIASSPRESTVGKVGLGLHYYLTRRFVLRLEFNEYVIFSANNSSDDNEEIGEWKTGFAIFF